MSLRFVLRRARSRAVCLAFLGLVSCASLPVIDGVNLAWAQRSYPDLTRERLDAARSLYAMKCGGCHRPHAPGEYPLRAWQTRHLPSMARLAKLTPGELEEIERYVVGLATRPDPKR